jgi:hypothetical protein
MCVAFPLGIITFFLLIHYDFDLLISLAGAIIVFLISLLIPNLWRK